MGVAFGGNRTTAWVGFGVALFLLLVGDLLTTLWGTAILGPGVEANPLMRRILRLQVWMILGIHALVGAVAILGFAWVVRIEQHLDGPARRRYQRWYTRWVGVLIVCGVLVVANNLGIIMMAG